jgi:hypothetical protein
MIWKEHEYRRRPYLFQRLDRLFRITDLDGDNVNFPPSRYALNAIASEVVWEHLSELADFIKMTLKFV